jgi:hypothetical protein
VEIPVIVEPADGGYRARCRHPVAAEATGATRHEATQALERTLNGRLPESAELVVLEAAPDKPWASFAGSIPDDELTEEWLDAIAENRRARDAADQATLPSTPSTQPAP